MTQRHRIALPTFAHLPGARRVGVRTVTLSAVLLLLLPVCQLCAQSTKPAAAAAPAAAAPAAASADFARTTIDLGMAVSDLERSVRFYKEAVGFRELPGFGVDGAVAKDAGLTNGARLDIRVLALGEGESATRLKLMQVAGVRTAKGDPQYIHSQYGFRYLTIYVTDTTAALARLNKAGVKPIAKTPVKVPEDIAKDVWLTVLRDPDGNLVELVGPRR
jgi:catechol 2,3-dioxygenase-like lactoylglutathione lyase family enzyme